MKTVETRNNHLIAAVAFILIFSNSCNNNKTCINNEYVNANIDTTLYEIDVKGDDKKELFVLIHKLYLKDSCFGRVNEDNIEQAYHYAGKSLGGTYSPYVKSFIYQRLSGKDTLLWTVFESNADEPDIITLLERYNCIKNGDKTYNCDNKFLSIISRSRGGLNSRIINLKYDTRGWFVINKELLITNLNKGYSIDTINLSINKGTLNSPKNEICFRDAFDNFGEVRQDK